MIRLIRRSSEKKLGLRPGSVVYVGDEREEQVHIDVIDFTATDYRAERVARVEDCFALKEADTMSWINVSGVHDVAIIKALGAHFDLHPLMQEDIANTGQRPKVEFAHGVGFVQMKMLYRLPGNGHLKREQVSILFGKGWVITFHETDGDVFDHVRKWLESTTPRIRSMSSGYVAYALMDAVVDHYFVVLEEVGEQVELLEDTITTSSDMDVLGTIRQLKTDLVLLRKAVWPMREVVGGLERQETDLIDSETRHYIRDLYEHTVQAIDTVETFRDMVSGLLDLHQTRISNRMNEIMKVLTLISTIFIPLSFLAGVYGMNFDTAAGPYNMPELGMRYGYPLFWLLVLATGCGLLWFFRRRRWF
jgi:magnesium transporter